MKEYSLIVTRVMAVTSESHLPFLFLSFPKSLSEMEADKEAYSFGLQLPEEFVNEMPQHDDDHAEWIIRKKV